MKIAYYVHLGLGSNSGVFKKIFAQISAWRSMGASVKLFACTRGKETAAAVHSADLEEGVETTHYLNGSLTALGSRLSAMGSLTDQLLSWQPDVVYTRYDMWYPATWKMSARVPTVLEINGDDLTEVRISSPRPYYGYALATRRFALQRASSHVYVSHELSRLPQYSKYARESTVIGNAIAMADIPVLPPALEDSGVRIGFIGQAGNRWHGVDKILRLASLCPKWSFDLVGTRRDELSSCPANVKAWGPLTYPEYRTLYATWHCAVSSLAMHRAGLEEGSPLKTREYLAHGLPVIVGYQDTDFLDGAPFLLQLPNTEDNVEQSVSSIKSFVAQWKGRRVPRESVAHLDVLSKERIRVEFLDRIAQKI